MWAPDRVRFEVPLKGQVEAVLHRAAGARPGGALVRVGALRLDSLAAMWLIRLAVSLTVGLTLATLPAHGQQSAAGIPRLCFLTFDPGTPQSSRFKPFFQGLRDLGWVDGQTITIDYLSADGRGERFPALAADCLRLKADIIVVTTTPAAQAAKNATRTIPIVMYALGDPVATGLVAASPDLGEMSPARRSMAPGLAAKRLALLKEAVPGISRVLVLSYLVDPIAAPQVKELKSAAASLGVKLLVHDIRTADDLAAAFDAGARETPKASSRRRRAYSLFERERVVELAARYRLPAMYHSRLFVEAGGLMAYAHNSSDLYRRAATYVDQNSQGGQSLPIFPSSSRRRLSYS